MSKQVKAPDVSSVMKRASKSGTLAGLKHREVQTVLQSLKPQISQALPKHLTPERMIQMATTIVTNNSNIAKCSASSIVGAVMQASILGFKPASALGQCYFVPYGGHVQFQIGYKGWLDLARRSGQIKTCYAYVVRKGDEFDFELGLEPRLRHKPMQDGAFNRPIIWVYAVAKYKDGGENFIVLNRAEIEALRKRNKSQKAKPTGAWASDYDKMAMAKAIKQLARFMPLSDEMMSATVTDEGIITDTALSNDGSGVDPDRVIYSPEEIEEIEVETEEKK